MCNYLLVYEYIVDIVAEADIWEATRGGATTHSIQNMTNPKRQNRNRTLLLGGRKDGYICVYNWDNGEVDFQIEAHGSKGVLSMIANSKKDQLISAGKDNVIKVWRLYPFAEEALAPLMSFYCAHTPSYMTTLRSNLCAAFEDITTATFSTVLYNLNDKNRHDHKPDDDHVDVITGLSVCERMKLFATSSMDGSIRIWNQTNNLVRLLKLNVMVYSIGFCNSKGDLLVGIGRHLHKIPYTAYMPKAYRFKMVTMKFPKVKIEEPLEYNENLLIRMNKNDVKRLKNSKSSFKFENYVDILSPEEEAAVQKEKDIREKAFSTLLQRDDELKQLKKNEIKAEKVSVKSQQTKDEAFDNYMKMFYDKPKITLPKDDLYPLDSVNEKVYGRRIIEKDEYRPEAQPRGFFPNKPAPTKGILKPSRPQKLVPGGFIPNSVLVKVLFPPPPPTPEENKSSKYVPPCLSVDQLQQIDQYGMDTSKRTVTFKGEELTLDMDAYEELPSPVGSLPKTPSPAPSNKSEEDAFWGKPKAQPQSPATPVNKFTELLNRTPTPKKEEEKISIEIKEVEEVTSPKREKAPSKPIKKLIARPPPVSPPTTAVPPSPKKASVPPSPASQLPSPHVPTPPPPKPETPLPDFITQYQEVDWFQKYFPTISPSTWPKPWSADAFAMSLLKVLRTTEFPYKTAITEALILLNVQEGFTDSACSTITRTILSILNDSKQAPVCAVDQEKLFILTAIRALNCFSNKDKDLVTELILQYLDGDKDARLLVCDTLVSCGLQDHHRHLEKELDSWDIWNIEDTDRKQDLRHLCHQWLDRWMTSYKLHIEDTLEKMKKGQNIHSRITKSQLQKHQSKAKKRLSNVSMMDDQVTMTTLPDGTEFIPRPSEGSRASGSHSSKSLTMTYGKLPDGQISESATYIDAINYFCDMMVEKDIEALRKGQSTLSKSTEKMTQNKNTVLVLPRLPRKQVLVRLGETHTCSKKEKDKTKVSEFIVPLNGGRRHHMTPGEISGFVPAINLPLKTVYINPFPNQLDMFDARFQEPVVITLKSEQKYFIQSNSVVPSYDLAAAPSS